MSREAALATRIFLGAAATFCAALAVFGDQAFPYLVMTLLCGVLATVVALSQRTRAEIESRYRRTEALFALYSAIQPEKPLPAPRQYMASPELLRAVASSVLELRPGCVLELGGGTSTLVAAYALRKTGTGHIISLDHEAQYVEQTNQLLRAHGLDDIAKVMHAPLVEVSAGDHRGRWYDTSVLAREGIDSIDLLIVDGPPGKDQPHARYPALPMFAEKLSARAWVIVDDATRKDEAEMVQRWKATFPRFNVESMPTEKGTTYLKPSAR